MQRRRSTAGGRRLALAVLATALAATGGGLVALWSWSQDTRLPAAGTIGLSVEPFHRGSLDLYVPVVDWGVRFGGVRLPARLHVDVRTVNRRTASAVAAGGEVPLQRVRGEARDAIARYLRVLSLVVFLASLLGAAAVAGILRRWWPALEGVVVGAAWVAAIALLLAPREPLDDPEYYARGADIPIALRAVENAAASAGRVSEEADSQLVGLAKLVEAPAGRPSLGVLPRVTIASDLHNNILAARTLDRVAADGPVLFPGDLTDSGSSLESGATQSVVKTGRPFVFTAGNHDSDVLTRRLASAGAIVLGPAGRMNADGTRGPVVVRVAGLRMAGYASPNERRSSEGFRDRGATITPEQQDAFVRWVLPLVGRVDVVLVHEPQLVKAAREALAGRPPASPLLFAVGHTHEQAVDAADGFVEVNGGTIGAGGTGNLGEGQDLGFAVVTFRRGPFAPQAADLIRVDPGSGAATAQRVPLTEGPVTAGDPDASSPEE